MFKYLDAHQEGPLLDIWCGENISAPTLIAFTAAEPVYEPACVRERVRAQVPTMSGRRRNAFKNHVRIKPRAYADVVKARIIASSDIVQKTVLEKHELAVV